MLDSVVVFGRSECVQVTAGISAGMERMHKLVLQYLPGVSE